MSMVSKVLTLSATGVAEAFDTKQDFRAMFIQLTDGSNDVTIGDITATSGVGIVLTTGDPILKIEEPRDGSIEPISLTDIFFVGDFIGPAFCKINILYLR